jgi:hypothetical protein
MSGRRNTLRGVNADNETAREVTSIFRKGIRETGLVSALFRRSTLPAQMSFAQFEGRLRTIYRDDDRCAYVKDWAGKTHTFPLKERQRALEFAIRLIEHRPIQRLSQLAPQRPRKHPSQKQEARKQPPPSPNELRRAYANRERYRTELIALLNNDDLPSIRLLSVRERHARIAKLKRLLAMLPDD